MATRFKTKKQETNGNLDKVIPAKQTKSKNTLYVSEPNFKHAIITIEGTAIYCQHRLGEIPVEEMKKKQLAGSAAGEGTKRKPKDFDARFKDAKYISTEGWLGIPCTQFRAAMVAACRCCGIVMTQAKLAVFIEPDGYTEKGIGLVKITKGIPQMHIQSMPNSNGRADLRARPIWAAGWQAKLHLYWDADMITTSSVLNLAIRAGIQCGIGEGRHNSKKCCGLGWGTYKILESARHEFQQSE